jgi:4-amino-4-deoxy-L-arabinose transferase-like glycosyltransferase
MGMSQGSQAGGRPAILPTLAVAAVAVGGLALRLVGIRFGDPFAYHPDEWILARHALTMVATGDWNPHNFLYPSLLIDLEAVLAVLVHAASGITLATGQPWLYSSELLPEQFGYVLAGRLLVALLGTGTILVVFEATRRLVGLAGAQAAAAIMAVVQLSVEHGHYLTTDVPMTFLCASCLLATVVASRGGGTRWWLAAALFAGLAGSTKWNGLAVVGVPVVAYLAIRFDASRPLAILRDPLPYAMAGLALIGFILPTPGIVLAPAEVASWLAISAGLYSVPDPRQTQDTITFNLATLVGTLGPLLAWGVVGMAAVVARVRRDPASRAAVAIPAFIVAYLILASVPPRYYARNLLPIVPYLAVAGGIALAALLEPARRIAQGRRLPRRSVEAIVGLALFVSLLPPLAASVAVSAGLRRPDTRDVARAWMLEHVPRGTAVAREIYTPQFDEREFTPAGSFFLHEIGLAGYRANGAHYLIASSWAYERYLGKPATPGEDAFYRDLFALPEAFRVDPGAARSGPTIRILRLDR